MASYNGGPGRVQRAIKRSGRDDFWKLTATSRYLPRETRDYVPMILAAVIIAKNPVKYGFDVVADEPRRPSKPSRSRRPSICDASPSGRASRSTRSRSSTPSCAAGRRRFAAASYELTVPAGTADVIRDAARRPPAPTELNALQWHVVKRGETLTTIARKLRVSRTDLAEANYLKTHVARSPPARSC